MSLAKPFNGDKSSENGSNCSGGGGSGNNSDNSALISLGNTSFGFNFDDEEGSRSSRNNSNSNSEEGDSDGSNQGARGKPKPGDSSKPEKSRSSRTDSSKLLIVTSGSSAAAAAAAAATAAVERLQSIISASSIKPSSESEKPSLKRQLEGSLDIDCEGYNSDDEGRNAEAYDTGKEQSDSEEADAPMSSEAAAEQGSQKGSRKKKKVGEVKREERNAREKERSFRISRQINELRGLLSTGGVIVPKGTKSSVLTEAANYIRMLQQHQYRSEIDRHQLVQQIQMIGGGALGQQAATAVRHVAAQNGVWSLGNFGGVPPKSAMGHHQPGQDPTPVDTPSNTNAQQQQVSQDGSILPNMVEEPDYRFVFNSCTVGMAIASMGGAFIDCNKLFSQLSSYTKQEVCSMTIFNFTAREDLQHAFDLISQMLSAPTDSSGNATANACVLRGSMKNRTDLGLSVTLIKGEDGVAKCFCVTLIQNPTNPFDPNRPVPATAEFVKDASGLQVVKPPGTGHDPIPRYTTG